MKLERKEMKKNGFFKFIAFVWDNFLCLERGKPRGQEIQSSVPYVESVLLRYLEAKAH